MDKQALRKSYMRAVALIGAAVVAFCAYRLPVAQLDLRFVVLVLVTLLSSRITIKIPRARGNISVSDTFIFLAMLIFGGEAAVLLAATEAFASSLKNKSSVRLFNVGVMALSTFVTASVLHIGFGSISNLSAIYSPNLTIALCVMALVQYGLNSWLVAVSVALGANQPLWASWRSNFLWTSMTYFAGAAAAGIVTRLIGRLGFYAFLSTTPIIAIIYFTYKTYLTNIETSAAQAEQARLHVEELNCFIAEQDRISKAFQESEEHFRSAFDYAAIGMALVSPEGGWQRVNRSLCEILGYTEKELLRSDFQTITHREDLGNDLAQVYRMLAGEILTCQFEKRYIHKLGHEVWTSMSASLVRDAQGDPLHFIFQIQDITERKRAESAIQTLSLVDELTGLYNRRGFLAFSKQHLNSLQRINKGSVVVYADLDGLKQINDSFGHKEGDRALVKTAELLKETFRSSDVLGRLGGDEFTVLAAVDSESSLAGLVDRLEQKFKRYNALKTAPYRLSVSIGLALLNHEEKQSIEDLMASADRAMYENKRKKRASSQPPETVGDHLSEAVA